MQLPESWRYLTGYGHFGKYTMPVRFGGVMDDLLTFEEVAVDASHLGSSTLRRKSWEMPQNTESNK
jgi:hypothetical protein